MIRQGDVYWVDLGIPVGSAPGHRRPCAVVQNNLINSSQIRTVVICVLTTNLRLAQIPGNVLLAPREGNLPQQSVVNVSRLLTVDKIQLDERIGALSDERVIEIIAGINLVLEP